MNNPYKESLNRFQLEYNHDNDIILQEFEFIFPDYYTDEQGNVDDDEKFNFPDNNIERYELLKQSTAKFHFQKYRYDYKVALINISDPDLIRSELKKLDAFREKAINPTDKNELKSKAVHYWNAKVAELDNKLETFTHSEEEEVIYLIYLHESGYFANNYLPNEVYMIDLDAPQNALEKVAEVYGRYWLLYQYLHDKLNELGEFYGKGSIKKMEKPSTLKKQMKEKILKDIWKADENNYHKLIDHLRQINSEIDGPFVSISDNKLYWTTVHGAQRYLAAFIYECNKAKLFKEQQKLNGAILMEICKNTFNIDSLSADAFSGVLKEKGGGLDLHYHQPFESIIKHLK